VLLLLLLLVSLLRPPATAGTTTTTPATSHSLTHPASLRYSIGVAVDKGYDVVLPRCAKLPVSETIIFALADPAQRGITLDVYEGEGAGPADNDFVGRFTFLLPEYRDEDGGAAVQGDAGDDGPLLLDGEGEERTVRVTFTMNAEGALVLGLAKDEEGREEKGPPAALYAILFFLVVLWLAARIVAPMVDTEYYYDRVYEGKPGVRVLHSETTHTRTTEVEY